MPIKPFFLDLDFATLKDELLSLGLPEFRARQIWQGVYHNLVPSPEQITSLSKDLRQKILDRFEFSHLSLVKKLESSDGDTIKVLFALPDGKTIETVLMHYEDRHTLCISSQSGCAMGCVFCATGQMGFARNLSSGEIIEQVLYFARELKETRLSVTNIVIMGMGEPFNNYEAVMYAVGLLNDPGGFNFGSRRVTISTVGVIPGINRFAAEKSQVNLAISLHAANDALRESLLPIARKYSLSDLMQACKDYIKATNRRLTFEWALIQGINDSEKDALELVALIKDMLCHVNVIPLNPSESYHGKSTTHERAMVFQSILQANGIPCTIRLRRGLDIQAGCGQLASKHKQA